MRLALALALAPLAAHAEDGVWVRRSTELCFPSGLRVAVFPDRRQPVVAVTAVVDVGSDVDAPGREGAAHLLEHLWFRARPGGGPELGDHLDALGAVSNAFTLDDVTVYVAEAPVDALGELIGLVGAGLADPLVGVSGGVIAQEKRIVATELARAGGVHPSDAWRLLPDGFLPDAPRGQRPSSPTSLAAVTPVDLAGIAEAYGPEVTTILLHGDVDVAEIRETVSHRLPAAWLRAGSDGPSTCPAPGVDAITAPPARAPQASLPQVPGPTIEERLLVGWALPSAYEPTAPVAEAAALLVEARIDHFLSTADADGGLSRCHLLPRRHASALVCSLPLVAGFGAEGLLQRLRDHLRAERRRGFPEGESVRRSIADVSWEEAPRTGRALARAHARIVSQLARLSPLESWQHAQDALTMHTTGSPTWYVEALDTIRGAGAEDVRIYVDDWLGPEALVAARLVPDARGALDTWLPDPGPLPPPPAVATAGAPTAEHRPILSAEWVLRNGMRLVMIPTRDVPVVDVALAFERGWHTEPRPGVDAWTLRQTYAGWYRPMSGTLADGLNERGALGWIARYERHVALRTSGTAASWLEQLDLLGWTLDNVVLPSGSDLRVIGARARVGERARAAREDPDQRATRARLEAALGRKHPATLGPWGELARGMKAPALLLDAYHRAMWQPSRATLVVAGPMRAMDVYAAAEAMFAGWKPRPAPPPTPRVPELAEPVRRAGVVVDDRPLASVRLTCRLPVAPEVEPVARLLLAERLYDTLRTASPAAYAPVARVDAVPAARLLELGAEVDPPRAGETALAMVQAVADLAGHATTDEGVAAARARLLRRAPTHRIAGEDLVDAALAGGVAPTASSAEVRRWLGACVGKEALTVVGPDPDALAGTGLAVDPKIR